MLEFQNVSIYKRKRKILDNFSLKLEDGVIFGLVGEDEEAKSAILSAAASGLALDRGKILLDGNTIQNMPESYLRIGYMSNRAGFYEQLKVYEYYELFLSLYKVNGRYRKRRVEEVLNFLELDSYIDSFLSDVPEDIKPFLALGKTILHEPNWLLLDDPFGDISIAHRKKMLDCLSMLWEQGTSLLINTNMFPEITSFVTDIAVIEEGKMVRTGTIQSVYKEALRESPLRLRVINGMDAALQVLRENDLVERVIVDKEDVSLLFSGGDQEEAELLSELVKAGVLVHSYVRDPMNLDHIMWR